MTEDTAAADMAAAEAAAVALNQPEGERTYLEPPEDQPGDDAAAAAEQDEDAEKPAPKPKQTAQERIDELTRARREAERDAEFWRAKATREADAQTHPQGDGRPDPADFDNGALDPGYIDALTDWKAEQAVEKRFTQREAQARTQTALQTFEQRVEKQYPDGEPEGLKTLRSLPMLSSVVQEVMMDSEVGPKLGDYLGDNPRELRRISALPPISQARELTKLEQTLTTPSAPSPKTATDAPEPAPTLRGAGGRFKVAPDTSDFAAFEAQYKPGG